MIDFRNMDCMELMAEYEDNHFDLAIVDPPYGIKMQGGVSYGRPSRPNQYKKVSAPKHKKKDWDESRPTKEYFEELFRVSKNQIVWGANYFSEYLPASMGWVYWGKFEDESNFSDGELAFTSFQKALKRFKLHPFTDCDGGKSRIHPTQKPTRLYTWLLANYAKDGDKILDTHVGSASSLIACNTLGFDVVGCELDEEYYQLAQQRIKEETAQLSFI